jgi:MFS family permease
MYLAETAPQNYRGTAVAANCLFQTFGQFIGISASLVFGWDWQWGLILPAFLAAAQLISGLIILPESPLWLMAKSR